MNPADAATRGNTVAKLKEAKEWFNGPQFLKHSAVMICGQNNHQNQDETWKISCLKRSRD
jgi:hypothetical protein